MGLHRVKKGLSLPIVGTPKQEVDRARPVRRVAVLAADFVGLRPAMRVSAGDTLERGQVLFEDKQMPGVRFTAPAAGTVSAIHRGDRRALQSVVIDVSRAEFEGRTPAEVRFSAFSGRHPGGMSSDDVAELLTESGLWGRGTCPSVRARGRPGDATAFSFRSRLLTVTRSRRRSTS